ncbi:MAG: hypothetical protein RIS36_1476 [Pseudomonadota bacterium]|jgi:hypothetical protein
MISKHLRCMGLFALGLWGCGPVIPILPGTPTSDLVLSHTSPESSIQRFTLDGKSYSAPSLSFQIPAGPHTIGITWDVTISDRCDPEGNMCGATSLGGRCSGQFTAEPNERYRILLDSRQGKVTASVAKRGSSTLYLGQDEAIVAPLTCEKMTRRDRLNSSALVTF